MDMPTSQTEPAKRETNTRLLDLIQSLGLLGVILIGGLLLSFASPVFFSRINIENLLFASTIIAA